MTPSTHDTRTQYPIPHVFTANTSVHQALRCALAIVLVSTVSASAAELPALVPGHGMPDSNRTALVPGRSMLDSKRTTIVQSDRPNSRRLWWPGWTAATCDSSDMCRKCDSTRRPNATDSTCLDPVDEVIKTKEECKRVAAKYIAAEKFTKNSFLVGRDGHLFVKEVAVWIVNHTEFPRGCFYYDDKVWLNKNNASVAKCYNPEWDKQVICFCSYDGSCLARAREVEDYKPADNSAVNISNTLAIAAVALAAAAFLVA